MQDQSGRLDEKELHICLLILYDKLNEKLPCHIRTPKPSDVHELYERHTGGQGSLSEQQFLEVAAELFASAEHWYDSVPVKVALTVGLQLALFPLIGVLQTTCAARSSCHCSDLVSLDAHVTCACNPTRLRF